MVLWRSDSSNNNYYAGMTGIIIATYRYTILVKWCQEEWLPVRI